MIKDLLKKTRLYKVYINKRHNNYINKRIEQIRKEGKEIVLNAERNSFQLAEIKHFFDIIDGKIENDSDVRHAYQVLKLTRGII